MNKGLIRNEAIILLFIYLDDIRRHNLLVILAFQIIVDIFRSQFYRLGYDLGTFDDVGYIAHPCSCVCSPGGQIRTDTVLFLR